MTAGIGLNHDSPQEDRRENANTVLSCLKPQEVKINHGILGFSLPLAPIVHFAGEVDDLSYTYQQEAAKKLHEYIHYYTGHLILESCVNNLSYFVSVFIEIYKGGAGRDLWRSSMPTPCSRQNHPYPNHPLQAFVHMIAVQCWAVLKASGAEVRAFI